MRRPFFLSDSIVRFPARPPLRRMAPDRGGQIIRLLEEEGWIEVRVHGDGVEVRSAHPLTLEAVSSNSFRLRLLDDDRADDETVS